MFAVLLCVDLVHVLADVAVGVVRKEFTVSFEHFVEGLQRPRVESLDSLHLRRVVLVERGVVHVGADEFLAELCVILCEEDVSMPERVDLGRDRMHVEWVEYRDGIVLLERENAAFDIALIEAMIVSDFFRNLREIGIIDDADFLLLEWR